MSNAPVSGMCVCVLQYAHRVSILWPADGNEFRSIAIYRHFDWEEQLFLLSRATFHSFLGGFVV